MVWIVLQKNNLYKLVTLHVRFQVLTAASLKMTAFWDVAPCSVVEIGRRFRDATASIMKAMGTHTWVFILAAFEILHGIYLFKDLNAYL
jgi:hypothetical protein